MRIFRSIWKVYRGLPTYSKAHAKRLKVDSWYSIPRKLVQVRYHLNDFWRSTIWDFQIKVSFAGFQNSRDQGINFIMSAILDFFVFAVKRNCFSKCPCLFSRMVQKLNLVILFSLFGDWSWEGLLYTVYKMTCCRLIHIKSKITKQWYILNFSFFTQ